MKRELFAILPVIILVFAVTPALAHPPESIDLSIDSASVLTVSVKHPAKKATEHYISKITVELNGNHIIGQNFRHQTDLDGQDVYYVVIDAGPGDKLSVTGECSIYGNLKVDFAIPAGTGE